MSWRALGAWWVIGLTVIVPGCKQATGLGAGTVPAAGPVLIHEPMGIDRVRFAHRETGFELEDKQSLLETAAGGSHTSRSGGYVTTTTTTVVTAAGDHSQKGVYMVSPQVWAANVHVDASRWMFFPLVFLIGRAYVEAQGELVEVGR